MNPSSAHLVCDDCKDAVFNPPKFSSLFSSHHSDEIAASGLQYLWSAQEPPPQQECTLCALIVMTLHRYNIKLTPGLNVPIQLYGSTLNADSDNANDSVSHDLSMIYLDAGEIGRSAYSVQALEGKRKPRTPFE